MNLANKITLLRVLMVPVFVVVFYLDIPFSNYLAASIFIIASFTDALDGHIARSRNLITNFGKFADPLADKVLAAAALLGSDYNNCQRVCNKRIQNNCSL